MAARTISEIKEGITAAFMRHPDVARAYGFEPGASFSQFFSKVSVESLLFYIMATATWTVEQFIALHRSEVEQQIATLVPHRPRWYRDKVLAFMKGCDLRPDADDYDTSEMTPADIARAKVVRHAAVTESADASILTIKVAGEHASRRQPLDTNTAEQLKDYIAEVKDAGVRTALVNQPADVFSCTMNVTYSRLIDSESLRTRVTAAVRAFIEELPFGGSYTHAELIDTLLALEGVRTISGLTAKAIPHGEVTPVTIHTRHTPVAGYYTLGDVTLNMEAV